MSKITRYQTFIAIVENGSLAEASRVLVSSPSSISKHLSNLEKDLGVQLIDRTTHTLSVTETGMDFYRRVKDILNSIDEAEEIARKQLLEPSGKIIISIPYALMVPSTLAIFKRFSDRYPDIQFDIRTSSAPS